MAYVFTLLLAASIVLLILGLFAPQRALFWFKNGRTKMKSATYYSLASLFSIIGLVATIPDGPETQAATVKPPVKEPVTTEVAAPIAVFSETYPIQFKLPGSDYSFPVEVKNVETRLAKNVFSIQAEQYSVPEKKDGNYVSFVYSITNPYDKQLICPLPDYFYLASPEHTFFSDRADWNIRCECDVNEWTALTTVHGNKIKRDERTPGCANSRDYCVLFGPGETKEFKVKFEYAVLASIKKLWLHGFDLMERKDRKLDYEKCLVVDLERKGFEGMVLNKR